MEDKRLYNEHLEKAGGCEVTNPVYKTEAAPFFKYDTAYPSTAPTVNYPTYYTAKETARILDSGNRREFESGAVRDIQEGKGRCDLLPLDIMGNLFADSFFNYVNDFRDDGDVVSLYRAIDFFSIHWLGENETVEEHDYIKTASYAEMCLEVAKHFEEGCKKYGENNWRKGIPVHCYIDSAVRHYLKYLATWEDEPHDRAVIWNLMCAIWTCDHMPELNEYKKETK